MALKEGFQPGVQRLVPRASLVEESLALRALGPSEGLTEKGFFPLVSRFHRQTRWFIQSYVRPLAEKSMDEFHIDH
jgi:hypothetical protein